MVSNLRMLPPPLDSLSCSNPQLANVSSLESSTFVSQPGDRLNTADIILLLISPNSLSDDTCYDIEIKRAMERHQAGAARVIPILLRPVDWQGALFSQLPVLPKNQQPVTSWDNRDEAFQAIAEGI